MLHPVDIAAAALGSIAFPGAGTAHFDGGTGAGCFKILQSGTRASHDLTSKSSARPDR